VTTDISEAGSKKTKLSPFFTPAFSTLQKVVVAASARRTRLASGTSDFSGILNGIKLPYGTRIYSACHPGKPPIVSE